MEESVVPLVSVSMIAYNAQDFIAEAIEGVLKQEVDFPIELVIGDDCSGDRTREICAQFAERHPGIIRLLPEEKNLGIGGNTARTMGSCIGKYIAVCDGDDIWTDPLKLKTQVAFLEQNPDYGIVYSDVETISETGESIEDPEQELIRRMYAGGDVFFKLLVANFINNSSALFRRDLLEGHVVSRRRDYQIPDHFRWLHIAVRSKVHFINEKTTAYRRHSESLSKAVPPAIIRGNCRAYQLNLFRVILDFDKHNTRTLVRKEKKLLFRKMMSTVFRRPGTVAMKWQIVQRMPRYFPGIVDLVKLGWKKAQPYLSHSFIKISMFTVEKTANLNWEIGSLAAAV